MLDKIKREPALVSGFVAAAIALGTAFGLDLSNEQVGAIMAVTAAILAIVTRQSVTPNVDVQSVTDAGGPTGVAAGPAADVPTGNPVQPPASADFEGGYASAMGAAVLMLVGTTVLLCVYFVTRDPAATAAILGKASILGKA